MIALQISDEFDNFAADWFLLWYKYRPSPAIVPDFARGVYPGKPDCGSPNRTMYGQAPRFNAVTNAAFVEWSK